MAHSSRAEKFDKDFELFTSFDPEWKKYLTDSTFFELMDWYDATYHLGSEESNSDEAHDFANYVWDKIHEAFFPKMSVCRQVNGAYSLSDMTEGELCSLLKMIKSACLEERRVFNRVKEQIEKILEK